MTYVETARVRCHSAAAGAMAPTNACADQAEGFSIATLTS